MRPPSDRRPGTTLLELLVTLVIVAVMLGVATLAFRRIDRPPPSDPYQVIADSLRAVASAGHAVTLRFVLRGVAVAATLHPDGSVVSGSALGIERLDGRLPNDR
jgi:hypothetical protein